MRRKKRNKESGTDESWLLPYADMLTLLLALFIILFAMSEIDTKKFKELSYVMKNEFSGGQGIIEDGKSPTPEEGPITPDNTEKQEERSDEPSELETMQKQMDAYIEENNLTQSLDTYLTDEGLLITILNDVTFDSGSAVVKDEGKEIAEEVSTFLFTDPPHEIVVSGHADDRPMNNREFASNWELSAMRAIQFMNLLLQNSDLSPKSFSAKGFGEHRPIVPNINENNRAKNRRVEVLILPKEVQVEEGNN